MDRRMSRRRKVYEGKAKVLFEGPEPGTLIQYFKDDADRLQQPEAGHHHRQGRAQQPDLRAPDAAPRGDRHPDALRAPPQHARAADQGGRDHPARGGGQERRRGLARQALRHGGGHRAAALDRRVLLQVRRARGPDGQRGAHHRVRLGELPGHRRDPQPLLAHQRLPDRPVRRHRPAPDRLQARVRAALGGRGHAHRAGRRDQPGQLPPVEHRAPTRSSTRTASGAISATSRKATRRSRAASASCPRPGRATSRGPRWSSNRRPRPRARRAIGRRGHRRGAAAARGPSISSKPIFCGAARRPRRSVEALSRHADGRGAPICSRRCR